MRKLLLLVLLGVAGFAGPSSAETVAQTASRWGIVGVWRRELGVVTGATTAPEARHGETVRPRA